jgi:hypothetical protein
MAARFIHGVKYVRLMHDNSLKFNSLEDNVYFTLRDIYWNADIYDVDAVNCFNHALTNGMTFEDRGDNFKYSNVLRDFRTDFTCKLCAYLTTFHRKDTFEFYQLADMHDINMREYMNYYDWLNQLAHLIKQLEEHLETLRWDADSADI